MSQSTDDDISHSPKSSDGRLHRNPLQRSSSSFFGAIKSFVAAPLYWLNGDQSGAVGEKRALDESEVERAAKKQRRSPGERNVSGSSFDDARVGISKLSFSHTNGLTPIPEPPPPSLSRSSSFLSPPSFPLEGHSSHFQGSYRRSSSVGFRSASQDIPPTVIPLQQRRAVSRSSLIATSSSPYRMRKSLTPQPVPPLSPSKREFSASRSSFMWSVPSRSSLSPVREFRREVSAPVHRKQLIWDETFGITTKEELEESSRASTPVPSTPAERALLALNSFRKPLVPPSFANDPSAYSYLKGGRKYAPPPLPPAILENGTVGQSHVESEGRVTLTAKSARMVRPYDGEAGIKKLLKKRASENRPEQNVPSSNGTQMEAPVNNISMPVANIGSSVSTALPQIVSVQKQLGGRISGSRSSAPSRACNPNSPGVSSLRAERVSRRPHEPSVRKTKFAVPTDDDDDEMDTYLLGLPSEQDLLKEAPITFEVPSGFSFNFNKSNRPADSEIMSEATGLTSGTTKEDKKQEVEVSKSVFDKGQEQITASAGSSGFSYAAPPAVASEVTANIVESTPAPPGQVPVSGTNESFATKDPDFKDLEENTKTDLLKPIVSFPNFGTSSISSQGRAHFNTTSRTPTPSLPFPLVSTPAPILESPSSAAIVSGDLKLPATAVPIAQSDNLTGSLNTPETPVAPTSFQFNLPPPVEIEKGKDVMEKTNDLATEAIATDAEATPLANGPPHNIFSATTSTDGINNSSSITSNSIFGSSNSTKFSFGAIPVTQQEKAKSTVGSSAGAPSFSFEKLDSQRAKTPEPMPASDRMEESPTRDTDSALKSSFAFGVPPPSVTSSIPFAFNPPPPNNSIAPTPFSFGANTQPPQTSNPFSLSSETSRPTTSGSASGVPFAFANTQTLPSTAPAAFTFGSTTNKATDNRASSPFTFAPSAASNPFGAQASTNIFSSPVQNTQPLQNESRGTTPFSFQSPTLTPSNAFSFGSSKPSSPALGTTTLPTAAAGPPTPFQFGATPQSTQAQGEPNFFTIGAAPPATPQGRVTKGLPKRRPATRR